MQSNREIAHRWLRPMMNSADRCDCKLCLRHDELMTDYEDLVVTPVARLLDEGWLPSEIVNLVKTGSPKSSRASMVVRAALVRWASERCRDPSFTYHISEVRQLAARTGFKVGLTEPGWFEQWYWNRGRGDPRLALRTVRHVREVLDPVIDLLMADVATTDVGENAAVWTTPSGRTHSPMGHVIPDPCDPLWNW